MSLIDTPDMDYLERFLDLAAFRQTLGAANLANIDTPGYQTRDISFQREMMRAGLDSCEDPVRPFVQPVMGLIERPDGNNVSLDRESLLLAQTQLQYKIAVELMKTEFHTLRGAINDGVES